HHYSALFAPSVVLNETGKRFQAATVLEPSPLLNADLPEWMLLHFQALPSVGWASPQVLTKSYVQLFQKNQVALNNVTLARNNLLVELADQAASTALLASVRKHELYLASNLDQLAAVDNSSLFLNQRPNNRNPDQPSQTSQTSQTGQPINPNFVDLGWGS